MLLKQLSQEKNKSREDNFCNVRDNKTNSNMSKEKRISYVDSYG